MQGGFNGDAFFLCIIIKHQKNVVKHRVSILGYGISLLTQSQACQVISMVNSLILIVEKNTNILA
jgi:hypothetical protein